MRAIKLDPYMTTVDEVILDTDNLQGAIAHHVGGAATELAGADGHVILVGPSQNDVEVPGFILSRFPSVAGAALIIGKNAGGYDDCSVSVADVADHIQWIDSEVAF